MLPDMGAGSINASVNGLLVNGPYTPLPLNSNLANNDSEHKIIVLGSYFTPVDLSIRMFTSWTPVSNHTICFETGVQERPFLDRLTNIYTYTSTYLGIYMFVFVVHVHVFASVCLSIYLSTWTSKRAQNNGPIS